MDDRPTTEAQDSGEQEGDFGRAAEQIERPLQSLVGDYEEESPAGSQPKTSGIFLLPNLFTTGALFCGFYAVIAGMKGDFYSGSVAVFVAMVFDGLDGRVARLTKTSSAFGAEYDSLADMVSFGVAPALLMFNWALTDAGKVGWVAAFLYTACAALRLARFNSQRHVVDASIFVGLASPPAAALIASSVWLGHTHGFPAATVPWSYLHAGLLVVAGFLMIARFPYFSFKNIQLEERVPFARILLMIGVLALIALDPPLVLWCLSFVYALSGLLQHLRRNVVRTGGVQEQDNDASQV